MTAKRTIIAVGFDPTGSDAVPGRDEQCFPAFPDSGGRDPREVLCVELKAALGIGDPSHRTEVLDADLVRLGDFQKLDRARRVDRRSR